MPPLPTHTGTWASLPSKPPPALSLGIADKNTALATPGCVTACAWRFEQRRALCLDGPNDARRRREEAPSLVRLK